MRPLSAHAFVSSEETRAAIRAALDDFGWPAIVELGGIDEAIVAAQSWTAIPEILILDVSDKDDQQAAITAFADAAPQGETDMIIIGRGDDIKTYRQFKELGAMEYVPYPVQHDDVIHALDAVRRAAESRTSQIDPAKLIVVTSPRGGSGGSTIAAEVARAVATRHGRRTLLLDLDISSGCQHSLFNVDNTHGFEQMLKEPRSVDALFLSRTARKTPERNLILLSDSITEAGDIKASAAAELVNAVAKDVQSIVVDVPARSPFLKSISNMAETVVIVAPPVYHGLRDTMALIDTMEKWGHIKRVFVVVNKEGEMRSGAVGADVYKQQLQKGANPDFRSAIRVLSLPYAPKVALRSANHAESLLNDPGLLGRGLQSLISQLPSAPVRKKEGGFLKRLLGKA